MKKYFLITIITVGCLGLHAQIPFPDKLGLTVIQPQKTDTILWSAGKKLKWDDFKCNPDTNEKYLSASTVSIECNWNCADGKFKYEVRALFSKSRSWAKKEGQKEYLLQHEQLHFNLTEVYARMLKKELGLLANPCINQDKIKSIIAELKEKHNQEQKKYDKETNHGDNKAAQKKWEENIKKRLNELDVTSKKK
ncbi:MAG: DUF922 domain-containing protein [Bacteroidetes bacterium]|nr:DUF922 domain-containing protein [Bacteroidota bacterium]